ncbi:hypothetical protein [Flavipsychrobacter stenotrophus]|nr:hypothetical protein [Flavipsychrobacter stenotrophus]
MLRKKISLLLALLLCQTPAVFSQPHIERSAPFEITDEDGFMKVVQFKNGKTCYLNFVGEGGITFKLFDAAHKPTISTKIRSTKWDADDYKSTAICATYEIHDELVIFLLQQNNSKENILHRIRVNEETGKIIKEDEIASGRKMGLFPFSIYVKSFIVQKDPNSDCYGVISADATFGKATFLVQHFDGNHNLISSVTESTKDNGGLCPMAIAVNGDKALYLTSGELGGMGDVNSTYISKLTKESKTIDYKPLEFAVDFKSSTCQMQFRHSDNKVEVLFTTRVKSKLFSNKSLYMSCLALLNSDNLNVLSLKELTNKKINEFGHTILAAEKDFDGVCNGFVLTNNNETFLLSEEMSYEVVSKMPGKGISKSYLGNIGITQLNADAEESAGYLIESKKKIEGEVPFMFLKDNGKGAWVISPDRMHDATNNQEVKFLFISGKKANYILINQLDVYMQAGNAESLKRRDFNQGTIEACYYTLKNGNMAKAPVFGNVTPGVEHTCYIGSADVNSDGVVATLERSVDGKKTTGHIVWLTFE